MDFSGGFFFNSVLLGVGLAMDAFSVSMANGLKEPSMKKSRMGLIAGVFAGFQALMPMIGWICVHTVIRYFKAFERFVPWIALVLLAYIGGKMIYESIHSEEPVDEASGAGAGLATLMVQGVATSIDALSVGFTIADYNWIMAIVCSLIIAVVTFALCSMGLAIGKKFGTRLAGKAQIMGGVILIFIGLEIFLTNML